MTTKATVKFYPLRNCYEVSHIDDHQLIRDAQALVDRAQREGSPSLFVPAWMLAQLIERATRPHD